MSVKIRLSKTGKTHRVSYRIVVQDTRTKRDGKVLENLGFWLPYQEKENFKFDKQKVESWIKKGAKPTAAVQKLLEGKTKKGSAQGKPNRKKQGLEKESREVKSQVKQAQAKDQTFA